MTISEVATKSARHFRNMESLFIELRDNNLVAIPFIVFLTKLDRTFFGMNCRFMMILAARSILSVFNNCFLFRIVIPTNSPPP